MIQKYPHPDGYLTIEAKDETEARTMAFNELGQYWSNLYPEASFDKSYYPKGELHRLCSLQPSACNGLGATDAQLQAP
jgi:hypothetical protein